MTEPADQEWEERAEVQMRAFDMQAATACDPRRGQASGLGYEPAVLTDDQGIVWAVAPVDFRAGGVCLAVPPGVVSEGFTARFATEVAAVLPRSLLVGSASSGAARVAVELVDAPEELFGRLTVMPSADDVLELLEPEQYFDADGRFPLGSGLVLAYPAWINGGVLHDGRRSPRTRPPLLRRRSSPAARPRTQASSP